MYPYTQWLMIIIPTKWLELGIYPIFRHTYISKKMQLIWNCRWLITLATSISENRDPSHYHVAPEHWTHPAPSESAQLYTGQMKSPLLLPRTAAVFHPQRWPKRLSETWNPGEVALTMAARSHVCSPKRSHWTSLAIALSQGTWVRQAVLQHVRIPGPRL